MRFDRSVQSVSLGTGAGVGVGVASTSDMMEATAELTAGEFIIAAVGWLELNIGCEAAARMPRNSNSRMAFEMSSSYQKSPSPSIMLPL